MRLGRARISPFGAACLAHSSSRRSTASQIIRSRLPSQLRSEQPVAAVDWHRSLAMNPPFIFGSLERAGDVREVGGEELEAKERPSGAADT